MTQIEKEINIRDIYDEDHIPDYDIVKIEAIFSYASLIVVLTDDE